LLSAALAAAFGDGCSQQNLLEVVQYQQDAFVAQHGNVAAPNVTDSIRGRVSASDLDYS
jgi:hypothetical protein